MEKNLKAGKLPYGGAKFALNYHILAKSPIDTRFVRKSYSDIKNTLSWNEGADGDKNDNVFYVYTGMQVVA